MNILVENIILNHVTRSFQTSNLGRTNCDPRIILKYILIVLQSGMPWRHLCNTDCPYDFRTVHTFFRKWSRHHVFKDAYCALHKLYSSKRRTKYHCIDSSYIKNIYGRDCVGRNPTDRGRKATKLSAIVDDNGIPSALFFCCGNTSDYNTVVPTLESSICQIKTRIPLYADKGYDSNKVRTCIRNHNYVDRVCKRGVRIHRVVNRKRGIVERFFSWLDKNRRLILRYDALHCSLSSFTWLASCRIISRWISQ